ncbi:MAG: ABC transporter ATP-binding protein [Deltaproteobacteria bacterium]|nr:ABC transporter ATP-binding protein [Deltaproteobacteria bacterium]
MDTDHNVELQIEDLHLNFGGVQALSDINMEIRKGEILSIIGPNGAGKTCILNCLTGFYRPTRGHIYYREKEITRLATSKIARLGISRTFQNIELINALNVTDNLLTARHGFLKYNSFWGFIYYGRALREETKNRAIIEEVIEFLELQEIRKQIVGTLPYGLRKRVELGRALAMQPDVLVLDEPLAGMNLEEKEDLARFILDIFEERTETIILIEHDMGVVMDISHRVMVIEFGRKIAEGPPSEIAGDSAVIRAYLGEKWARQSAEAEA